MSALLTAQNCNGNIHLVVGTGPLAASRCAKSLEVGARPVLICTENDDLHFTLLPLIADAKVQLKRKEFEEQDLTNLGREEIGGFVDAVFVTHGIEKSVSVKISTACKRLRIPVNVVDAPHLCTFTLLSTYSDGPLQVGITTSGRGCRLSARIRREIAAALPRNLGASIDRLGAMRRKIWEEDHTLNISGGQNVADNDYEDEESANQKHTFNTLIHASGSSLEVAKTRRMRWFSQICEYWPLSKLANISDEDIANVLETYMVDSQSGSPAKLSSSPPPVVVQRGTISLAGSGPGHPSLLTLAAQTCIQTADYILADKLVPTEILALIPRRTPVHIARKFPGNADAAQEELLTLAHTALKQGKHVLRLKQGDPYLYGRGAEEVQFFRENGYEPIVIPGVTSALSAPLFAGIPVTHRGVADTVVVCTGTGRKGAAVEPPAYQSGKTVVFLMALHRLASLVQTLTCGETRNEQMGTTPNVSFERDASQLWPQSTPCAVIERASCPDQRVIRSTLEYICQAVEEEGSRPPGLLVVGRACTVLHDAGNGGRWIIQEGFRALDDLSSISPLEFSQLVGQHQVTNVSPVPHHGEQAGESSLHRQSLALPQVVAT